MSTEELEELESVQLSGSDIGAVFSVLHDAVTALEARADVYRSRRTAHARNSLSRVEWEIRRLEPIRDKFRDHYMPHVSRMVRELAPADSSSSSSSLEPWEIVQQSGAFYVQRADGSSVQPRRYYVRSAAEARVAELERADLEARG